MARQSLKNVMRLIDSVKDELPAEQMFLADLKRTIEFDSNKNTKIPSKTYKPSSMNCLRQSYFQLIGAEQDTASANYAFVNICNSGTDIHVRIQNYVMLMRQYGMDCDYIDVAEYVKSRNLTDIDVVAKSGAETKLYHKIFNMSFLCDGIIKYKNRYYILELKTESVYKWSTRTAVDESHYKQATAYSIALGIDDVIFVYINRDVLDMKAFLFTPTAEMKEMLVGYIETCDEYLRKNEVPPKPLSVSKKTCSYCMYTTLCERM